MSDGARCENCGKWFAWSEIVQTVDVYLCEGCAIEIGEEEYSDDSWTDEDEA